MDDRLRLHGFEDDWSEGSVHDGYHPWDTHHDQGWARPRLAPLPKTQCAERKEMDARPDRSPDAYWDPDKWNPEYKSRGSWVLPEGEQLKDTKGFEMKMLPVGLPQSEINKHVKTLTREKKTGKGIEWTKQEADRRTLSWMDQFNPPDNTDIEWMDKYDEDTRHQWEETQTIHPKDWKTKHQAGNTLPPQHDVNFIAWKAKFSGDKDPDGDPSVPDGEGDKKRPSVKQPQALPSAKGKDGDKDPDPDSDSDPQASEPEKMSDEQRLALIDGGATATAALLGTLGLLVRWGWGKGKARKDQKEKSSRDKTLGNSQKGSDTGSKNAPTKVQRYYPRD
jgi:hypothetical protein